MTRRPSNIRTKASAAERRRSAEAVLLRRVERAAEKAAEARAELEAAVLSAAVGGVSVRPIAAAADRSFEWARQVIARGDGR